MQVTTYNPIACMILPFTFLGWVLTIIIETPHIHDLSKYLGKILMNLKISLFYVLLIFKLKEMYHDLLYLTALEDRCEISSRIS